MPGGDRGIRVGRLGPGRCPAVAERPGIGERRPLGSVDPRPSNGTDAPALTVMFVNPMTAVGGDVDAERLGEFRRVAGRVGGRGRHEPGPAGRRRELENEVGVARRRWS